MCQTSSEQVTEKPLLRVIKGVAEIRYYRFGWQLYQQSSLEQGTKERWVGVGIVGTPNTMDYGDQDQRGFGEALYREIERRRAKKGTDITNPKLWLAPTTMDKKDDSLKHATKL